MYLANFVFHATAAVNVAIGSIDLSVNTALIATPGLSTFTGLPYVSYMSTLNVCGWVIRPDAKPAPETTAAPASRPAGSTSNATVTFASAPLPIDGLVKASSTSYVPLVVGVNVTEWVYTGTNPAAMSSVDGGSTSVKENSSTMAYPGSGETVARAVNESCGTRT